MLLSRLEEQLFKMSNKYILFGLKNFLLDYFYTEYDIPTIPFLWKDINSKIKIHDFWCNDRDNTFQL